MGTLTIRNINACVKEHLHTRAASRHRSMEQETRVILTQAMGGVSGEALWNLSREFFSGENGVELTILSRSEDMSASKFRQNRQSLVFKF